MQSLFVYCWTAILVVWLKGTTWNLVQVLWSFFVILDQHQSEGIKGWKIYYWVCVFCCSSKNCAKVSIFWWPGCSQAPRKALAMLYLITSCVKANPNCISSWSNTNCMHQIGALKYKDFFFFQMSSTDNVSWYCTHTIHRRQSLTRKHLTCVCTTSLSIWIYAIFSNARSIFLMCMRYHVDGELLEEGKL